MRAKLLHIILIATALATGCQEQALELEPSDWSWDEYRELDCLLRTPPTKTRDLPAEMRSETVLSSHEALLTKSEFPFLLRDAYYTVREIEARFVRHRQRDDFTGYFSPDVIYPGNILRAGQAIEGEHRDIPSLNRFRRAGLVYLGVVNGSDYPQLRIRPEGSGPVNTGVNQLIGENHGGYAADIRFDCRSVYSKTEFLSVLGRTENDPLLAPLMDQVNWDQPARRVVVHIPQTYFRIIFHPEARGAEGMFQAKGSFAELKSIVESENGGDLAYISEVSYGRCFVMVFEEYKRGYLNDRDIEQDVRNLFSTQDHAQPIARLSSTMRVYAHQLGGEALLELAEGPDGLSRLCDRMAETANYTKGTAVIPVAYRLMRIGEDERITYTTALEGSHKFLTYTPKEVATELHLTLHNLRGKPIAGPIGGNYPSISHRCYFELGGVEIEKCINGQTERVEHLADPVRFNGKGGHEHHFDKTIKFTNLNPIDRDVQFKLRLWGELYGERYGTGRSDGQTVRVERYAIITFDKQEQRWVCSESNSDGADTSSRLLIKTTADRCLFEEEVNYDINTI